MECRPIRERVEIVGDVSLDPTAELQVLVKPNLADHPLVCGPRYAPEHLSLMFVNGIGYFPSGIMIGFMGPRAAFNVGRFNNFNLPKVYEVRGEFGFASRNFRSDGKIIAKEKYGHLTVERFHRVLTKFESNYRNLMNQVTGVTMGSENAYQAALKGNLVPPSKDKLCPFVYSIKPLVFEPPNFSIRIECLHENEIFLSEMIHHIGKAMRSVAMCTSIRLFKHGPFKTENTLLSKHWTLENVIENIYNNNLIYNQFLEKMTTETKQD